MMSDERRTPEFAVHHSSFITHRSFLLTMTWLLQRVLDLIELIVNWFYTRKYGVMARRFGRGTAEDDGRRGLIILQIDGLSHATFKRLFSREPCRTSSG